MTTVSAQARLRVHQPGEVVLQVAVAGIPETETLRVGGLPLREIRDQRGSRFHLCDAPAGVLEISYDATIARTPVPDLGKVEHLEMLRPSRFCPSDLITQPVADTVEGIEQSVHDTIAYVLGSSGPSETALDTLERGSGVCRDFAHIVVTMCRAIEVPARVFSAYAPGLEPQDFHLVAEVWDGAWRTVDATRLVDPDGLIRICTGRDAADTAWMTTSGPDVDLEMVDVQVS